MLTGRQFDLSLLGPTGKVPWPLEGFHHVPTTNLERFRDELTVYSLNDNDAQLFEFQRLKFPEVWVVTESLKQRWKSIPLLPHTFEVGLAARKKSDVLLLRLHDTPTSLSMSPVGARGVYARAAFYSWIHLLRKLACTTLDVETNELSVNIRSVRLGTTPVCEAFLMDTLENGAGYSTWLSDPSRLVETLVQPVVHSESSFLRALGDPRHADQCDSSCYNCLRDFDNSELHMILDWRLGLDMAALSASATADMSITMGRWRTLAKSAANTLATLFVDSKVAELDHVLVVRDHRKVHAVLTHPLWSEDHPAILSAAQSLGIHPMSLPFCTVFDALRRPGWFLASNGIKPRQGQENR